MKIECFYERSEECRNRGVEAHSGGCQVPCAKMIEHLKQGLSDFVWELTLCES